MIGQNRKSKEKGSGRNSRRDRGAIVRGVREILNLLASRPEAEEILSEYNHTDFELTIFPQNEDQARRAIRAFSPVRKEDFPDHTYIRFIREFSGGAEITIWCKREYVCDQVKVTEEVKKWQDKEFILRALES